MSFNRFKLSNKNIGFEDDTDILEKHQDKISSHYHNTSDNDKNHNHNFIGGKRNNYSQNNRHQNISDTTTSQPTKTPCFLMSSDRSINKLSSSEETDQSSDFTLSTTDNNLARTKVIKNKLDNSDSSSNLSSNLSSDKTSTSLSGGQEESDITMTKLQDDYVPRIFQIPQNTINILDFALKTKFKPNVPFPQFSLGFQHFIHQSKNNFQKVNNFAGRAKPYLVLNKFQDQIDDYTNDLKAASETYLNYKNSEIINKSFYKLWEIIITFNLINNEDKNFTSAHLSESSGSFTQATMFFRNKFCNKNNCKDDKYIVESNKLDENIITLSKEKPQRMFILNNEIDLRKLKDIRTFIKFFGDNTKDKANFVTANGDLQWVDRVLQEQEVFPLVVGEIYTGLSILASKGNFVCKVFETYTDATVKLIYLLNLAFTNTYISKPLTSNKASSEKYLVCVGFKEENKTKILKALEEILIGIESETKNNYVLNDIFSDFKIPQNFRSVLINANTDITNRQFQALNEIIQFIEDQNYRGDEYTKRRTMQIEATKFWINTFYPNNDNLKNQIKKVKDFKEEIVLANNNKNEILSKKILY